MPMQKRWDWLVTDNLGNSAGVRDAPEPTRRENYWTFKDKNGLFLSMFTNPAAIVRGKSTTEEE